VRALDGAGNASHGHVLAHRAHNNVVHANNRTVVLYGVDDLVVVEKDGLVLVTSRDAAADLKSLIDVLPDDIRTQ
jgi:mannose-1-phosphate guanylyltransferase